ncbi:26S proteasome regulatory subunit 4 homolog B-like isoform X1 [Henckelia pumila]|uniref:26S proteasome regulatory subunit 4 homolog B-like isoform X1 n=1 Tax=Henckelia pumila TaxID=405737 RepID=UPI003C6DFBE3
MDTRREGEEDHGAYLCSTEEFQVSKNIVELYAEKVNNRGCVPSHRPSPFDISYSVALLSGDKDQLEPGCAVLMHNKAFFLFGCTKFELWIQKNRALEQPREDKNLFPSLSIVPRLLFRFSNLEQLTDQGDL